MLKKVIERSRKEEDPRGGFAFVSRTTVQLFNTSTSVNDEGANVAEEMSGAGSTSCETSCGGPRPSKWTRSAREKPVIRTSLEWTNRAGFSFYGGPRTESWVQCLFDEPSLPHRRATTIETPRPSSPTVHLPLPLPSPRRFISIHRRIDRSKAVDSRRIYSIVLIHDRHENHANLLRCVFPSFFFSFLFFFLFLFVLVVVVVVVVVFLSMGNHACS